MLDSSFTRSQETLLDPLVRTDAPYQPDPVTRGNPKPIPTARTKGPFMQASPRSGYKSGEDNILNLRSLEHNPLTTENLNDGFETQSSVLSSGKVRGDASSPLRTERGIRSPHRVPSVSSTNSTLYQPMNAGYRQYPTKTAFKIAPYGDPKRPASPSYNFRALLGLETRPTKTTETTETTETRDNKHKTHTADDARKATEHPDVVDSSVLVNKVVNQGQEKLPSSPKHAEFNLRNPSQQPIHCLSMDDLDAITYTQSPFRASSHPSPTISTAKSLGSLLEGPGRSMRSYGQPTLL